MSEGHTPGPWEFASSGKGVRYIYASNRPQPIARPFTDLGRIPKDEFEANARLIAAAPELLDALEDLANDISERFDMDDPSTNPGIRRAVEAARAALAKARGEG